MGIFSSACSPYWGNMWRYTTTLTNIFLIKFGCLISKNSVLRLGSFYPQVYPVSYVMVPRRGMPLFRRCWLWQWCGHMGAVQDTAFWPYSRGRNSTSRFSSNFLLCLFRWRCVPFTLQAYWAGYSNSLFLIYTSQHIRYSYISINNIASKQCLRPTISSKH